MSVQNAELSFPTCNKQKRRLKRASFALDDTLRKKRRRQSILCDGGGLRERGQRGARLGVPADHAGFVRSRLPAPKDAPLLEILPIPPHRHPRVPDLSQLLRLPGARLARSRCVAQTLQARAAEWRIECNGHRYRSSDTDPHNNSHACPSLSALAAEPRKASSSQSVVSEACSHLQPRRRSMMSVHLHHAVVMLGVAAYLFPSPPQGFFCYLWGEALTACRVLPPTARW